MQIHSFINGQESKSTAKLIDKKNPYNSTPQHQFYSADLMQTVTAIQVSQKFFGEFKSSSFADRLSILDKIRSYIKMNELKFAKMEAADQGLHFDFVSRYSIAAAVHHVEAAVAELKRNPTGFFAVGVVSIICSWNLSFRLVSERLFAAIAAGNTVIVKISSTSPVTAAILAEIIRACELPSGLIQIILSDDDDVKKILVTHPGVKAVSFVGQLRNATDVIRWVASVAPQQFKKLQIATGTKNTAAAMTEPTNDIFQPLMHSFLRGQGQLAWNSSRLFVLEKNEKQWLEKIAYELGSLKPAESIEDDSVWTPVLREGSYKTFAEISALAVTDQARLLKTNYDLNDSQKSNFLPITFTRDMSNCSTLQQDQVMSPLFIISTVKYPFDIQKYSNVSYFGLAAHLWGEEEKLRKLTDSLDVGLVCKNKWSVEVFETPKAFKQSGFGLQDYRAFGDFFSNAKKLT